MKQEQIEELKKRHPGVELVHLTAGEFEAVVRPPNRAEWKRFSTMSSAPQQRADAVEGIFRSCCVFPDAAGVEAMLERKPGLAHAFGGEVVALGVPAQEVEKKAL